MLLSLNQIIKNYNLNIKGVIHIGAHYGQEYKDYIKHNINNLIFFEPLEKNYKILLNNIQLTDTVKAYNIALGNFTGTVDMYVESFNQGMSSSILEPNIHLTQYPDIIFNEKENVKIDKLDNIQFDKKVFNMINIDVQGYELEVFKGATETLKTIDIIYTEVNNDDVYKKCAKINDLDDFLLTFGFYRVLTSMGGITWGDALFLKK